MVAEDTEVVKSVAKKAPALRSGRRVRPNAFKDEDKISSRNDVQLKQLIDDMKQREEQINSLQCKLDESTSQLLRVEKQLEVEKINNLKKTKELEQKLPELQSGSVIVTPNTNTNGMINVTNVSIVKKTDEFEQVKTLNEIVQNCKKEKVPTAWPLV
eukprot:TRINITY_DN4634_c0_g1_i1.p1 TRINITY_DN4634_c0_g1~~TRINITY_DN4634_c0_g1_i1.p1  ORF type:complete len:157 (+),score=47.69 TRINITY_DN4634_c0_g1_i1:595-1065(+)